VPNAQEDKEDHILSPTSFFGSTSWLDSKPGQTPNAGTNWLSDVPALAPAPAPEEAPDTARTNSSANWLQAPEDTHDAQASTVLDPMYHRSQCYDAQGEGHARHKESLPPLPLKLPPLPPTPPSTGSKSSARGRDLAYLNNADTSSAASREWLKANIPAVASDDCSRGSGTSTPVTPEDDPDDPRTDNALSTLGAAMAQLHTERSNWPVEKKRANRRLNGKKSKLEVRMREKPNPVKTSSPRRSESGDQRAAVSNEKLGNGHSASMNHNNGSSPIDMAPLKQPPASPAGARNHRPEEANAASRPPKLSGDGHWTLRPNLNGQHSPSRASGGASERTESEQRMHTLPRADGLRILEHLNDYRFSCGVVADKDRSARQKACYGWYFSPWKRTFLSLVIILHSALAFAEFQTESFLRRKDPRTWRPPDRWIQALQFLFTCTYIADAIVMTIALTLSNMNPRQRARNAGCVLVVFLVTTDTLLTAANAATSSFSLPFRLFLLIFQLPGLLRMLHFWLEMVCRCLPMLTCTFGAVVCLAAVAVAGVREGCPQERCSQDDVKCNSGKIGLCLYMLFRNWWNAANLTLRFGRHVSPVQGYLESLRQFSIGPHDSLEPYRELRPR
jgi:hypothetical protein